MRRVTRRALLGGMTATTVAYGDARAWAALRVGQDPFRLGVNLAGAEFAAIGGRWQWPRSANLAYYLARGLTVFRVPFLWERLQPELNGVLDADALIGLTRLVTLATQAGAVVILDAHNYGRRDRELIGAPRSTATIESFAQFWGAVAQQYGRNPLVWYGLMNEPHDQSPAINLSVQNVACAAIRAAGATGKVLFSGVAWTGAHSWLASGNATVMLNATDTLKNYAFDAHQYLDRGFGGSSPLAMPGAGTSTLRAIRDWARAYRKRVFLGEFAAGPGASALNELRALLSFMKENRDVFLGGTYFAGGGVWGMSNVVTTDPLDLSRPDNKPQLRLLMKYGG